MQIQASKLKFIFEINTSAFRNIWVGGFGGNSYNGFQTLAALAESFPLDL